MSTKKKIALVNVFFAPQSIGGATRVLMDNFDLLRKGYAEDYDLVVFTSDHGSQKPHTLTTYLHEGVRVYRAGIVYRINMDWNPHDPVMGELFSKFLELEKPDIVHFHCIQRLGSGIVEATIAMSIPYIVTIHDAWWISDYQFLMDRESNVYQDGHPDVFAPLLTPEGVSTQESLNRRTHLKSLLSKASSVQVVSQAFEQIYNHNGVINTVPNPNGINSREWKKRATSYTNKICIAHIGGMAEHKGYHIFKQALLALPYKNLEALVVDHSVPSNHVAKDMWGTVPVKYIGKVPQEKIEDLYAQMDVLVAVSIWPESFGLVTREATAAGVWVIASNIGGIGEDVVQGVTGVVIPPALNALIEVCHHLDQLGTPPKVPKHAKEQIRTVRTQVDKVVETYGQILHGGETTGD